MEMEKHARRWAVRSSAIHGRGVFALRLIHRWDRVGEYLGRRYPLGFLQAWGKIASWDYVYERDDRELIDGAVGGNGTRFINHSCSPNCKFVELGRHVYVVARKAIWPGQELTLDYHAIGDLGKVRCNCGSSKCRGSLGHART